MEPMLARGVFLLSLSALASPAQAISDFPESPNLTVTPGSVCQHADQYRYPEHIAYCKRDVASSEKREIIRNYDAQFGFSISQMNRGEFKIDHHIPLCMGGSNSVDNLWPQHRTVYEITDPIEPLLCELLSLGKIKQIDAIRMIRDVKQHLDTAPTLVKNLHQQLSH